LEILRVLWKTGPIELGGVRAELQKARPIAASTIATMLKVMLVKGLVRREDGAKGYLWSATAGRRETTSGLIGRLLDLVFDGSARPLVAHLIREGTLSEQDRAEIRRLLDQDDKSAPSANKSKADTSASGENSKTAPKRRRPR
jgi:predicted transcriptional regulator